MKRRCLWRPRPVALTATLLLLTLSGCGGVLDSSVSGTVTLDGKPLRMEAGTGTVSFHPEGGGPAAQARIGADGRFVLKTGSGEGLPSGDYVVTVVATGAGPKTPRNGVPMPGPLLTPTRYGTRKQSDLRFTVNPGANEIDIPLTSR